VRKAFIAGLRPDRLRDRANTRAAGARFAEARNIAAQESELLAAMMDECSRGGLDGLLPQHQSADKQHLNKSNTRGKPFANSNTYKGEAASATVSPPTMTPAATDSTWKLGPCRYCGKKGHLHRDCSLKPKDAAAAAPGQRERVKTSKFARAGKVAVVVPDQVPQAHGDGLRRTPVILRSSRGDIIVHALWDTGASIELCSKATFNRLLQMGVLVSATTTEITGISGAALPCNVEVSVDIVFEPTPGCPLERSVIIPARVAVLDGLDEDLVLSMPLLTGAGLISMAGDPSAATNKQPTEELVDEQQPGGDVPVDAEDILDITPPSGDLPTLGDAMPREPLMKLCQANAELFGPLHPAGADLPELLLELQPGHHPTPVGPRRTSPAVRQAVQSTVDEWKSAGIVVPSKSRYCSPLLTTTKRDGSFRVVTDFRNLSSCTIPFAMPLPDPFDLLEQAAGHSIFGKLDARNGFLQCPLASVSQHLTAFATSEQLFQYTRVPFGISQGPGWYQHVMYQLFHGLPGCAVFIDDILCWASSPGQFMQRLSAIFERASTARLRFKGSKCLLGVDNVEYLGHVLSADGIRIAPSRLEAVRELAPPKSRSQLRSALGFFGYMRVFVPGFASRARPLHALTSEKQPFEWTDVQQSAFDDIKQQILAAPLLHHLDYADLGNNPIIVRTDASSLGVGGQLVQRKGGGMASKGLLPTFRVR
jgi:hypothetical protein